MRYPNAPARPKFSKALALTTVSTMALLLSVSAPDQALASCVSPGTSLGLGASVASDCEDDVTITTDVTNVDGAAGTLAGIARNQIYGIVLTEDGSSLTNTATISASITSANIGVITQTSTAVDTATSATAGTRVTTVRASDNTVISVTTTALTSAQAAAAFAAPGNTITQPTTTSRLNTATVAAINTDVAGSFTVENDTGGTIVASHGGVGRVNGISGGGDTLDLTVENHGKIFGQRGTITLSSNTAGSLQGADPDGAGPLVAANLGVSAGVYAEEELESLTVNNYAGGQISATGTLSSAIYSRAGELTISNEHGAKIGGQFTYNSAVNSAPPIAIAAIADNDERQAEVEIENSGQILGSIVAVNANALRWYSLSQVSGTLDSRLTIGTGNGVVNTNIENAEDGEITGNIYLGSGAHNLVNEGTISGDIDVDQRTLTTLTAGGLTTTGEKRFRFENAGTFNSSGNVTVRTELLGTGSTVVIAPHIYGEGTEDGTNLDDTKSGYIGGQLKVYDGTAAIDGSNSTMGTAATIAPIIDSLVRSDERYTVANSIYGTVLPNIEGSGLVSWEAEIGTGADAGKLFIEATVANASTISGLSAPGVAALNGLMNLDTENEDALEFAGAIQNLSASDVKTAGEQLAPDTSRATTNATNQLASLYSNAIGQRLTGGLNGTGSTGGTGFAPPSGLGMGSGEAKPLAKPMYLQGSGDDAPVSQGREAAWAQAFGAKLNQDAVSTTGGYDADLYGFMGGYDGSLSQNFRAGMAFGYGNTSISETGVRQGNATEIESYNATAYAAVRGAGWYLTGQLGYTSHDFMTQRRLSAGGVTANAKGTHDGDQFTAAGELGTPIRMAGAIVTPVASLAYNKLDQDAYTETGTAGFALAVGSQSSTSLVSGLGVRTALALGAGTALEARAIWLHEFDDTNQAVTATFASASNAFTSTGASLSADSANLGAGLNMNSGTGYALQLNYDAYVSDDFIAHAGTGRIRVEF